MPLTDIKVKNSKAKDKPYKIADDDFAFEAQGLEPIFFKNNHTS